MPFPYTTAILTYVVDASPGVDPAALKARLESCPLDTQDTSGAAALTSDVTVQTATGAKRTLTFALGEAFNSSLQATPMAGAQSSLIVPPDGGPSEPNPPLASASGFFQNLYTHTLQRWCASYGPTGVRQLPPILT